MREGRGRRGESEVEEERDKKDEDNIECICSIQCIIFSIKRFYTYYVIYSYITHL